MLFIDDSSFFISGSAGFPQSNRDSDQGNFPGNLIDRCDQIVAESFLKGTTNCASLDGDAWAHREQSERRPSIPINAMDELTWLSSSSLPRPSFVLCTFV